MLSFSYLVIGTVCLSVPVHPSVLVLWVQWICCWGGLPTWAFVALGFVYGENDDIWSGEGWPLTGPGIRRIMLVYSGLW